MATSKKKPASKSVSAKASPSAEKKDVSAKKKPSAAKTPAEKNVKKSVSAKPEKAGVPVAKSQKKSAAAKKPVAEKRPAAPSKNSVSSKKQTLPKKSSSKSKSAKKDLPETETVNISVPRDVSQISGRNKIASHRSAMAYSPVELEHLLFQRGVTNMNIFNPNATPAVPEKKPAEKKIILTTLPKSTEKRTIGAASMADLFGFDPFAKDSVSQEEKLIPAKWVKYYHKLQQRKEELMETINRHSQNAFRKEGKEETGDVSAYSQHTADIDNEAFDRDFAISRLAMEQEELSEINIAVERMKKGTYGICEITGKPIPAERLNKMPFTRYSLEGKVKAEEQRRAEARRRRQNITGDISEIIDIENDAPIALSEEREEP